MKLVYVQTVVFEEELEKLKKLSGETSTKDALRKAVEHYLECPRVGKEKLFDLVEDD